MRAMETSTEDLLDTVDEDTTTTDLIILADVAVQTEKTLEEKSFEIPITVKSLLSNCH